MDRRRAVEPAADVGLLGTVQPERAAERDDVADGVGEAGGQGTRVEAAEAPADQRDRLAVVATVDLLEAVQHPVDDPL